jgi:hypothetical protein
VAGDNQVATGSPHGAGPVPQSVEAVHASWPRRRRRGLVLSALALAGLLAGGIAGGFAGAAAADDQEQVDTLAERVTGLERELAETRAAADEEVAAARSEAAAARSEAEADVAAENATREAELAQRSAELDAREAEVAGREVAVTGLEQQAADGGLPGDGIYLVGTEVAPGTYRAESPTDCYWERRSGLSGDFGDIITNGLGAGDATVTIRGSDVAFSSSGCGRWTRIG